MLAPRHLQAIWRGLASSLHGEPSAGDTGSPARQAGEPQAERPRKAGADAERVKIAAAASAAAAAAGVASQRVQLDALLVSSAAQKAQVGVPRPTPRHLGCLPRWLPCDDARS
jgi:hypothetical protein